MLANSSSAPAFIAVVQMWYKRSEQTNRNAAWYAMLGVVNILGSLLSYGLGHIVSNKLHSYQIIFLFCGLLTAVVSVFVFIFMPDSPMEAKFLNHGEKLIAVERLRMNQMGVASRIWKWDHVLEAFLDVKTWLWFSMLTAVSCVNPQHFPINFVTDNHQVSPVVASQPSDPSLSKPSASANSRRFFSTCHLVSSK